MDASVCTRVSPDGGYLLLSLSKNELTKAIEQRLAVSGSSQNKTPSAVAVVANNPSIREH
jgi:hypothetical protein